MDGIKWDLYEPLRRWFATIDGDTCDVPKKRPKTLTTVTNFNGEIVINLQVSLSIYLVIKVLSFNGRFSCYRYFSLSAIIRTGGMYLIKHHHRTLCRVHRFAASNWNYLYSFTFRLIQKLELDCGNNYTVHSFMFVGITLCWCLIFFILFYEVLKTVGF